MNILTRHSRLRGNDAGSIRRMGDIFIFEKCKQLYKYETVNKNQAGFIVCLLLDEKIFHNSYFIFPIS
jgi:hypothetical protein